MNFKEFSNSEAELEDQPVVHIEQHEGKTHLPPAVIPMVKKAPAVANLTRSILNRNRMGAIANTQKQIQKFKDNTKEQQKQKVGWVETSKKMSDLYAEIKSKISKEKQQIKSIVHQKDLNEATKFDEIGDSDLVKDALETSLSWIDRIPTLEVIQEHYGQIKGLTDDMEKCGLLEFLKEFAKEKDLKMNSINEKMIFKDLLDVQREELIPKLLTNPKENKKAISIENLIDQANRQTSDVVNHLDQNKHALDMDQLKESIKVSNIQSQIFEYPTHFI